jgi:hypothetical protein
MFIHFGCAILKHEPSRSDIFLKTSLMLKLVLAVLIVRASLLGSYDDLLFSLLGNTTINMALSLYIWAHGITFLDVGRHMHTIKFQELWNSVRRTF